MSRVIRVGLGWLAVGVLMVPLGVAWTVAWAIERLAWALWPPSTREEARAEHD